MLFTFYHNMLFVGVKCKCPPVAVGEVLEVAKFECKGSLKT